ncbi:hypothetical protein G3576_07855 [Roseomonas stagni]|uniref:Tyr recombinase domain-containing protein n=1 Tax=Falsiroseomonas algicola TaxID=2716930 RepID=A0A6M1LHZ0_9PROT|nr:DUF6538 domain-containing protein [Falsiroseomonas algicola]NGM19926.1 hypothetical protein [Falsiroseomonas algicola]
MALPMCRPTKHPKTGVYRIRMRVPKDLIAAIGKRERIESLGTKNPGEARKLAPAACERIEAEFAAARAAAGPASPLSLREVMALCGEWYCETLRDFEDDPGPAAGWAAYEDQLFHSLRRDERGDIVGFDPSSADLEEARLFLAKRGIAADAGSLHTFAAALFDTKRKVAATLAQRAEGDYSPDPHAASFPKRQQQAPARPGAEPPLPAEDLLKAWAAERRPSPATLAKYGGTFRAVARVLGFDDVRRITPDDVVRFKRHRLETEKRDPGTVEDDIRNAGAVCTWATTNRMLPANPFAKLAPKAARKLNARDGYDDDDAKRMLVAARAETGWLRWAPWLLCFTGARIGELAELRRRDVREDSGVPILDIVPHTLRPGKNETMQRMIPLHPALIGEGFLAYVATLPADPNGPLFPSIKPDPHGKRDTPAQTTLGRWVRAKVKITDPKKAPAHSWRHRMIDQLRTVRAVQEVQDAITGHYNPRNAGAGYGKGFRGMPDEVLKDLGRVPSPVPPLGAGG